MKTPFDEWNEDSFDLTGEFEIVDSILNLRSGGRINNANFATRTKRLLATQEISRAGQHAAYEKMREQEFKAAEKIRKQKEAERNRLRKETAARNHAENPNRVDYDIDVVQTASTFNETYGFTPDPVTHTHVTLRDKRVTRGASTFIVNGIEFLYGTASALTKNKFNILAAVGKNIVEDDYGCDSVSVLQLIIREYKEFTVTIIRARGEKAVEYSMYKKSDCPEVFDDIKTMWPLIAEFFPAATLTETGLYANYKPE